MSPGAVMMPSDQRKPSTNSRSWPGVRKDFVVEPDLQRLFHRHRIVVKPSMRPPPLIDRHPHALELLARNRSNERVRLAIPRKGRESITEYVIQLVEVPATTD